MIATGDDAATAAQDEAAADGPLGTAARGDGWMACAARRFNGVSAGVAAQAEGRASQTVVSP